MYVGHLVSAGMRREGDAAMSNAIAWRPIPGYEGYYEVSEDGCIRRSGTKQIRAIQNVTTLPSVSLNRNGIRTTRTVASLVAEAFIGPASKGSWVYHLDGDPTHNHWQNLTYRSNAHAPRNSAATAKLTSDDVLLICGAYMDGHTYPEIAQMHGVSIPTVQGIIVGRTWKHVRRPAWFQPRYRSMLKTETTVIPTIEVPPGPVMPPSVMLQLMDEIRAGATLEDVATKYAVYQIPTDYLIAFGAKPA